MPVAGNNDIYSNAFNFDSFLSGGVDPRTGIYSCRLSLGNIQSQALNGPALPLSLHFNPLNSFDRGFGIGWMLTGTRYDRTAKTLSLASGETYKTQELPSRVLLTDQKLEHHKLHVTGEKRFLLSAQNGQCEELAMMGLSNVAMTQRIWSANGASIELAYTLYNGHPMLSEVRDSRRTLLSITRTGAGLELKRFPGSDKEATFVIHLVNGRLSSITLPGGGRWEIRYLVLNGLAYLSRLYSPLGAIEHISYKTMGLRFPEGSSMPAMASVATHSVFPGNGQPSIHKHFNFSDTNFLGFGAAGFSSETSGDRLYKVVGDYSYASTETLMSGGEVHSETVRTFNKFHLLDAEVTRCGAKKISERVDYHTEAGKCFRDQPAQCRLPKRSLKRYEDVKTGIFREEVTQFEFDTYGNEVKRVTPDGLTTLTDYFPSEGADGCPADPLMFVRFPRQKTVFSATHPQEPHHITRFRYTALALLEGATVASIIPEREQFYVRVGEAEVLHEQTDYEYAATPQDPTLHGRPVAKTSTLNGLATKETRNYVISHHAVTVETVLTGHDESRATDRVVYCAFTGGCLSRSEEDKAPVEYEYDALGRVTRETVSKASSYQASKTRAYQLPQSETQYPTLLITDVNGMQQRVTYDGIGRVCTIEEQDVESTSNEQPLRLIKRNQYNSLGQLHSETVTDWLGVRPLVLQTRYAYDDWGQVKTTLHPEGVQAHVERSPEHLSQTCWKQGQGKTVTFFNTQGKPLSVETFDLQGVSQSKTTHVYDGFGRCIRQTDPEGNETAFEYDAFGRLCRSTLPDATVVETRYALFSSEELPVQVQAANKVIGTQTFDGLGRLVASNTGGRKTTYEYAPGSSLPRAVTRPDGQRSTRDYEAQLDGAVVGRTSANQTAVYGYDPRSGLLTRASEQGRTSTYEYSRAGRLKREQWALAGQLYEAFYTYSLGGRVLSQIGVDGSRSEHGYDAYGRLKTMSNGALKAECEYNALGQMHIIKASDAAHQQLITTLNYDELGREVQRVVHANGIEKFTLKTRYTRASKVAQRSLLSNGVVLRDEHFDYDRRGRLIHYRCNGSQRPCNPLGKEIVAQRFEFDAWDNIVLLQTDFEGGQNTTTYTMSESDPTQLIKVEHSHADYPPAVTLRYDANGHLILDAAGRTLSYDGLGRLTQVSLAVNAAVRKYGYDAGDRLVEVIDNDTAPRHFFYRDDCLVNEVKGSDTKTFFRMGNTLLGQEEQGAAVRTVLLAGDSQKTVLGASVTDHFSSVAYDPYGNRSMQGDVLTGLGFNGERLDSVTECYLLGNGYRSYDPLLMRFQSPDNQSPFGAGGLNPYAYCLGDPINRSDPTGHSVWEALLGAGMAALGILASIATFGAATPLAIAGLVAGVTSGIAGIASAVFQGACPESGAGEILGYVSLGLGLLSVGIGLAAMGKAFSHVGNRLHDAFKSGLDGKGALKAGKAMAKGAKGKTIAPTVKWKVIAPKPKNIRSDLSESALNDYQRFVRSIEEQNLHPGIAAQKLGDAKYTRMSGTAKNIHQYEIRIGGKDRVTFLLHKDSVEILQVGGHALMKK